ncbi:hypothetical protein [Cellulosimicrobium cellulans]|uniref:hypothetical protein n=1 Tax=Cellulosimicrobium cellulans TaxID=1710 RepID=UPI00130EF498|nr:hypothetical protein [Cellulosimicrobium cellulans]
MRFAAVADQDATPAEVVEMAVTGAGVLAAVVRTAAPGVRAFHPAGAADAEGFADLTVPGDAVTGLWEVQGTSVAPVPYDGVLAVDHATSASLAGALAVHYGEVGADGQVARWHSAGTLAEPVPYGDALTRVPAVSAERPAVIPVRVSLPDPSLVTGDPGQTLAVTATFTVSYLDGGGGGGEAVPPPVGPPGGGDLAVTGAGPWAGLLAALLLAAGAYLRSRRRRATG